MTSRMALRVMLADDHALVRSAIRQALTAPDIEVVAEVSTGEDALRLAPEHRPDILLLDLDLPGISGLQVLRELAPRLPSTRIIILTVSTSQRDVNEAVRLGAVGYLTKDLDPHALLRAIRGAAEGDLAMPRRLAARTIRELVQGSRPRSSGLDAGLLSRLSPREEEILRHLGEGLTDREIGDALRISSRTVETHVSNILHKLSAKNRAEAARLYREER